MEQATARHLLSSLPPEKADEIFKAAKKAAGSAKPSRFTGKNIGRYNAIVLPEIPAQVLSVKDGEKKAPDFDLIGQQVVCSRNLSPPVTIEYVTLRDSAEHDIKIGREMAKLRPKS